MSVTKSALIADDHSLYRNGLSLFLQDQFSFVDIAEASSFEEAVGCMNARPGIELALFDLSMPGMHGPRSLAPLRLSHPNAKIAIVAASENKDDILATIGSGLNGFIPKSLTNDEVKTALEIIMAGRIYVPGLMMAQQPELCLPSQSPELRIEPNSSPKSQTISSLSNRQRQVLDCVQAGMPTRAIAEKLGISIGTVKSHMAALRGRR